MTLTSRDGGVTIEGTLLGYDGEFYRVETVYGALTVDGSGVNCEGPGCPDLTAYVAEFNISGARTMGAVLLPALVESFAARSGYRVERKITDDSHFRYELYDQRSGALSADIRFRVTSTAEGFADLVAQEADIVLSVREPLASEVDRARAAGVADLTDARRRRIVGLDALVPLVSPSSPLERITLEQLASAFAGEIDNWAALGGPDAPIRLHLRDAASGLAQGFVSRVMVPADLTLAASIQRHASNEDLADAVARDPLALGVANYSEIGNGKVLAVSGGCGILNVASAATLRSEDYPLTTPLFLYTPAKRLPLLAREFIGYIRSPAAQPVIARAGFVNLFLERIPLDAQGERLANAIARVDGDGIRLSDVQRLVRTMRGSARLSVTFRFQGGSSTLDAQSESNVELLAQMLESGRYNGTRITFVGFSDSDGAARANLGLSRKRAEVVRDAVLAAAPTADRARLDLRVDAFGEVMPMACDTVEWGRQVNRRVEVWIDQR
ncbi:phosphate ABC transporter substrate-binding/OmpA family protein [Anianabacter salinae]|uniref:phosphate ABC transporter substrate-binding/OmpA family protein n=1 Tax=Anianabacter salinae TaxID=2851023 RepID=UPI002B1FFD78|nr:phosphate ABC transporter substrate-binding/OmpA family protein [Anianabacter salinae]